MMRVETMGLEVPRTLMEAREDGKGAEEEEEGCSTTSSSSIGRDSDDVSSERSMDENGENEAESAYNGPLHAMETLEQVLPIRRGISKFYNGKSKSFTTLADAASSPSMKDIAKPENAYTRRRRNLMAFSHVWDKSKSSSLLRSNSGGISKRAMSTSRSSLALVVAMNNSDSSSSITSEDSSSSSNSSSPRPPLHLRNRVSPCSPLQRSFSEWRSYSSVDLQNCAIAATIKTSSPSSIGNETAHPS